MLRQTNFPAKTKCNTDPSWKHKRNITKHHHQSQTSCFWSGKILDSWWSKASDSLYWKSLIVHHYYYFRHRVKIHGLLLSSVPDVSSVGEIVNSCHSGSAGIAVQFSCISNQHHELVINHLQEFVHDLFKSFIQLQALQLHRSCPLTGFFKLGLNIRNSALDWVHVLFYYHWFMCLF